MDYSAKTIIDKNSFNILEVLKDTEDYNDAFVAKIEHNCGIAILKIARNELLENEWTAMKKLSGTGELQSHLLQAMASSLSHSFKV